jgi:hypothetical protein
MDEGLIRGTAILAVTCYAARIIMDVAGLPSNRWRRRARVAWSLGGALLILHVVFAFQFRHAWSHAAAWEQTRQRTLELTGWETGAGVYANHAMTAVWLIDIIGWSVRLDWPQRYRGWYWFVQAFLAFMMFNATAVFGPWYWKFVVALFAMVALKLAHDASVKRR